MTLLEQFNEQEAVLAELDEQEQVLEKRIKSIKEHRELIMCEVITRTDVLTEALLEKGIKKIVYKSLPVATTDWLKIYAYIEGFFSEVSLNVKTGVLLIEAV